MRIVEAGIDNFGCLHQRVFPFDDGGLTVFEESNGYGKSTLAVFIKAMFYGLSGKARNVNGNERKKYMPWQGGSFGGYLIYEKDGVRYRIVRKFGKTRKEDTFSLSEEDTGKRIVISADSLGDQLFGLDVSSFERSVVFPQGEAMAEFSTSQISQRLTGLIEASDRNSGYDIAIKQIDETRKSLKPFRGDGGELASVNRSITDLQNLIASKEQDRILLNRVRAEVAKCDEDSAVTQGQIDKVRSDIEKLSIRQSENALCEQRDDLVSNVEELAAQLKESSSRMISPAPSLECIEAALETAKRYESLSSTTLNRSGAASSLEVTEILSYRFNQGVPSKDSLREVGREIDDLEIKKSELARLKLSEKEEMDLFDIQEALPSGFSGEETLDEIRGLIDKKNELSGSLASIRDTPSLEKRRTELEDFFSGRVPSGDQIAYMEERLNTAENLRARSSRLFSDASSCDGSRLDNSLNGKWIALILLGLLCAAAGCALFSLSQQFSMGVVLVVCGVACVVLALVFGKGNTRASVLPKDVINDASRIQATKLVSEAAGIDEEVRAFVDMYFGDGRPSRAAIDTLRRNLDELRQIEETINSNYSDSRNLEDQLHRCEIDLREALGGFWADDISIQSAFFRLQASYSKLLDLEERKREYDKNKGGLETAIRAHSDRIEEYLLKYESKDVSQGSYREMLNRLSVDAASYAQAKKALLDQDKVNTERLKELEELRSQMREFAEAVGSSDLLSYQGIQQIRDERLRISDFESRLKEASSKLSAFINLHPDIVDKQIEGPTEDFAATLKELKKRESQFIEDHDKLLSMINECRANERRLAKSVDLVPQLQDELDDLTAERSDLERRVFVLDSTKEMLAKAKESLSHKYLGPVVQAFDKYCSLLFGDSFSFRVDENLSIMVEHKGDFKESAFLSAGLEDLVAVCMRMALVDALYPGEDMFIILDDPFVNLDDRNMRRALDLVERMSQYRQILYLTCHSSRMPC